MSIHTIKDSILGVPREEDNSTYLIYPQSYPRPHFINHYMLNLWYEADGKTFQKLFEEYQNRYRDVPIEKIQSDIINSIIYLYNLNPSFNFCSLIAIAFATIGIVRGWAKFSPINSRAFNSAL